MTVMKNLKQLVEETKGMTPVQFEKFAEENEIFVEWMEVCVTNLNEGMYEVYLPEYDSTIWSVDGSEIQFWGDSHIEIL
jgi:hypothetical protein